MAGKLIYGTIMSADGYVADAQGNFDWAEPPAEVHAFANELERAHATMLYGRRMYEVMTFWEDETALKGQAEHFREYGELWRAANKIVFSKALPAVSTERTELRRVFRAEDVAELKARSDSDISIGGPTLAAEAFRAGLVDECHLIIAAASVGGGTPALPVGLRLDLQLLAHRTFAGGMAHLHYAVRQPS
jgi:dihydrofolate reductase